MERKDKLEEYISSNRLDFDDAFPSLKSWAEIEKSLDSGAVQVVEGTNIFGNKVMSSVIIGLLAIIAGLLFYMNNGEEESPKTMLYAEVENLEHFYDLKTNKMIRTVSDDFQILSNPDLEEIDTYITEIKEELNDMPSGSEEKALQALLDSYRTKLMIIERILEHHELSQPSNTTKNDRNI